AGTDVATQRRSPGRQLGRSARSALQVAAVDGGKLHRVESWSGEGGARDDGAAGREPAPAARSGAAENARPLAWDPRRDWSVEGKLACRCVNRSNRLLHARTKTSAETLRWPIEQYLTSSRVR